MIQLRFVRKINTGKFVLQERHVPMHIGWLPEENRPVIQPANEISLVMEHNWTEWKDVQVINEEDLIENENHGF